MADYGTNAIQAGDVLLFSTLDGGEINVEGGIVEMTQLYETMAYLELLGGNDDDDGSQSTELKQWWGNEGEPKERQYRSRFQSMLVGGAPITSQTISDLEDAAREQLTGLFVGGGFAESVSVDLSLTTNKRVDIASQVTLVGGEIIPIIISKELT